MKGSRASNCSFVGPVGRESFASVTERPRRSRSAVAGISALLVLQGLCAPLVAVAEQGALGKEALATEPTGPTPHGGAEQAKVSPLDTAKWATERRRLDVDVLLSGLVLTSAGLVVYELSSEQESALYDRYRERDEFGKITGITHTDASAAAARISTEQTVGAILTGIGLFTVGVGLTLLLYDTRPGSTSAARRVSATATGIRIAF